MYPALLVNQMTISRSGSRRGGRRQEHGLDHAEHRGVRARWFRERVAGGGREGRRSIGAGRGVGGAGSRPRLSRPALVRAGRTSSFTVSTLPISIATARGPRPPPRPPRSWPGPPCPRRPAAPRPAPAPERRAEGGCASGHGADAFISGLGCPQHAPDHGGDRLPVPGSRRPACFSPPRVANWREVVSERPHLAADDAAPPAGRGRERRCRR